MDTFRDKKPQRIVAMHGYRYRFDDRGALVNDEAGEASLRCVLSDRERKLSTLRSGAKI